MNLLDFKLGLLGEWEDRPLDPSREIERGGVWVFGSV